MGLIKVKTSKENRWGKMLNISGVDITFNAEGIGEVDEKQVSRVLNSTIELVDKNIKVESNEERELIENQSLLLDGARKEAQKIIEDAKKQASHIVEDAKKQAGITLKEEKVDEKQELRLSLEQLTVKEIKAKLIESHVPESEFKNIMKKDDLIEFTINTAFSTVDDKE